MSASTLALCLAACATSQAPPRIEVREVKTPALVDCVPTGLEAALAYPDTDEALLAAPGAAERYLLMAAGRLLRQVRLAELEAVTQACRSP